MAWMVPIYLVWLLECDLHDVNRVASSDVHFPPSTKPLLLMLLGVGFEGLRDRPFNHPLYQVGSDFFFEPAFEHVLCHIQFVVHLQTKSELRGHFEIPGKSQNSIGGNTQDTTTNIRASRGPLRILGGVGWSDYPDFACEIQG